MTETFVVWLMGNHVDKGNICYADNFYSSTNLNRYLVKKKMLHWGTVRKKMCATVCPAAECARPRLHKPVQ